MPIDIPKLSSTLPAEDKPKSPRSRASNRKALTVVGGDRRGGWARRFADIYDGHIGDLGDEASEAERSIVRRASVIETELERLEFKFAAEGATLRELDGYQRAAGNLRRLLEAAGLKQQQQRRLEAEQRDRLAATRTGGGRHHERRSRTRRAPTARPR